MSLEDGAERKFWETPEFREKLYPYLDLGSMMNLAECHKLTRDSLKKALIWNRLINRTVPENIYMGDWWPTKDDEHLASERPRIRHLARILSLIQDSPGAQLETDLIHAVTARYPVSNSFETSVDVTCACSQTHRVSPWGFVFLEDIQATLGSRETRVLELDTVSRGPIVDPLLAALSCMVTRQQGTYIRVQQLHSWNAMVCQSREDAEAIENITRVVHASSQTYIKIRRGVGSEGWASIRRAVENLAAPPAVETIGLISHRKAMVAGSLENLKAIWAHVPMWCVYSDGAALDFTKEGDGERGWKELVAALIMTDEEWHEKVDEHGDWDTEYEFEPRDEETEEEAEDPGPE